MGWITLIVMVALVLALMWRFGNVPRTTLELLGAALCVAVTGYALQGSPAQPGTPVISREVAAQRDSGADALQKSLRTGYGDDAAWLNLADALERRGATQEAVLAMRSGIRDHRNSPDLWVGLGRALIAHGDGVPGPAALFAFRHAAALAPDDPGPPFFLGLALAQQGKSDEAAALWRKLLAKTPPNAPWRAELEARLAQVNADR
jgi:cytochrome c-type biogenesis protein CcmH